MLTNLAPDLKRKLRSCLNVISKAPACQNEATFFTLAMSLLEPWKGIFEIQILQDITGDIVTPRLARWLVTKTNSWIDNRDLCFVNVFVEFFESGLLSDLEFLSLVEAEILPNLARLMFSLLRSNKISVHGAAEMYWYWKNAFLLPNTNARDRRSWRTLQQDSMICRHFLACLLIVNTASGRTNEHLADEPPMTGSSNYKVVQARRAREERLKREEDDLKGTLDPATNTIRKSYPPTGFGGGATFRDVVQDVAAHHEIPFHPKIGQMSSKDGKQIFLFGNEQIYIDRDVVFALRESQWIPTTLDDLVARS